MENTHALRSADPPGLHLPAQPISNQTLPGAAGVCLAQPNPGGSSQTPPQTHAENIKEQDIDSGCLQSPSSGAEPDPTRQPPPQLIAPLCPSPLTSRPASTALEALRDMKTRSRVKRRGQHPLQADFSQQTEQALGLEGDFSRPSSPSPTLALPSLSLQDASRPPTNRSRRGKDFGWGN